MIYQSRQRQYLLLHTKKQQDLFAYAQTLVGWRLIPTPPEVTSGCGQSLKLDLSLEQFLQLESTIKPYLSAELKDSSTNTTELNNQLHINDPLSSGDQLKRDAQQNEIYTLNHHEQFLPGDCPKNDSDDIKRLKNAISAFLDNYFERDISTIRELRTKISANLYLVVNKRGDRQVWILPI